MTKDEIEQSKKWLEKAEKDFDDAKFNIENNRQNPGLIFLQQSIEKALKAKIISTGGEPDYTHNLMKLAEDSELPEEKTEYLPQLTNLYTGVRYPGEEVGEIENLEKMLKSAEEVLEWTQKQLKQQKKK